MPHSLLPTGRAGGAPSSFLVRRGFALAALLLGSLASLGQVATPRAAPPKTATPRPAHAKPAPATAMRGRTTVDFAKGFTISYVPGGKVLTILSPFEQKITATRYLLVPRGAARPTGYADAIVVETPIRTLVGLSSMHVALVDFLGADDVLVGLGNLKYASAPRVRQRIAAGKILEAGQGKELHNEQLIAQHPDLVMATGWPGEGLTRYQTLQAAGVPVMINSEWVESTPLGRAEWVKVMAALLDKEALVNQKFDQIAKEYRRLAALAAKAPNRPRVILNMPFKDVWYVPEAGNYMTTFLRDAGATYPWAAQKATGSLPLTVEAVAPVALTADYWLQTGTLSSRSALAAQDARFKDFKPYKTGQLYNYNRRTNAQGSNDYWESGAVRPDLVLGDLIQILHPALLPGRQLYYYQKLRE